MEKLYKFLTEDGRGTYSDYQWPLPTDTEPGAWVKVAGELVPCANGLHFCRPQDVRHWFAATLYEAEYRGVERVVHGTKVVVREARLLRLVPTWNDRTARLFACDCAERVLPFFEREYPNDTRVRDAIAVARRFAKGQATYEELGAAQDAAGTAAGAAVWTAAWAAAWAAAGAAARAAAGDAEGAAAWDAEIEWQNARLLAYINGEIV